MLPTVIETKNQTVKRKVFPQVNIAQ